MGEGEARLVLRPGADTDMMVSKLITRGVVALLVLAVAAGVKMFRHGAQGHYMLLLVGALFTIVSLWAYPAYIASERGQVRRAWWRALFITVAGLIPYLFGCYLVFYEGFWRMRGLLDGFSASLLVVSLLFVVGGWQVVNSIYKATEFGRAVSEGRVKFEPAASE
jgi:hypothetical protein